MEYPTLYTSWVNRQQPAVLLIWACLLAAYFPFNTHMAIYSSFWSQIVWWLIALYCAAYGAALAADAPREKALGC
jgi:hypothetical protein